MEANRVFCDAPLVWTTEILDGTPVSIKILPYGNNPGDFEVGKIIYTKSAFAQTGDFNDSQGRSFHNILRYGCYEQRVRGKAMIFATSSTTS